jgi:predicted nucleotidyltransferase
MYGLLEQDIHYIMKALKQFAEIDRAILFGSRALGNYKKGSDVDIAISGQKVTDKVIFELDDLLNEVYPLPYFFDIIHLEKLNNQNLIEQIENYGKILYVRNDVSKEVNDKTTDSLTGGEIDKFEKDNEMRRMSQNSVQDIKNRRYILRMKL